VTSVMGVASEETPVPMIEAAQRCRSLIPQPNVEGWFSIGPAGSRIRLGLRRV
jgi:hypothetical protein